MQRRECSTSSDPIANHLLVCSRNLLKLGVHATVTSTSNSILGRVWPMMAHLSHKGKVDGTYSGSCYQNGSNMFHQLCREGGCFCYFYCCYLLDIRVLKNYLCCHYYYRSLCSDVTDQVTGVCQETPCASFVGNVDSVWQV